MPTARKVFKRIILGLLATIILVVLALIGFIHTDRGREVIRAQVEARMNDAFVGGATVGKIEGSPFGHLVAHDVTINGPDGKPAIVIGKATLKLGLLPLISHQATLAGLVVEDVDVDLRRDPDGELQIAHLLKPGPKSKWSIHLPDLVVARGHLRMELPDGEVMHLDDIAITGAARMPYAAPLDAGASIRATWRERDNVPLAVQVSIHVGTDGDIRVPVVMARAGDVEITGANLHVVTATPVFQGALIVRAPKAGVARLAPDVELPADAVLAVTATERITSTHAVIDGWMGGDELHATIDADVANKRASGIASTSQLDLARWTHGKIAAHAGGLVLFDVEPGPTGSLPLGNVLAYVAGTYRDLPYSRATIVANSDGTHVGARIGASNVGFEASIDAAVTKLGDKLTLDHGAIVATTRDPARASAGKAPVHGRLVANLTASGALAPKPDLVVAGHIDGAHVRAEGVAVDRFELAVDARGLPAHPRGRAKLAATGITRGTLYVHELSVDAANRADDRIDVSVRSHPRNDPSVVEADAVVALGNVVTIDLLRHRVRIGNGNDWTGTSGRIAIGKQRIEVTDVKSSGKDGAIALAGTLQRTTGDLDAAVDVQHVALTALGEGYAGTADAHASVQRRAGKLVGDVELHAKDVVVANRADAIAADAKIHAAGGSLTLLATGGSPRLGAAKLAVDVDAPANIADVRAWKQLTRRAIRDVRLTLTHLSIPNLAQLAGIATPDDYRGHLEGDIRLTDMTAGGTVKLRDLHVPALRAAGAVNADLVVSQAAPDELTPALTARVDGIGGIQLDARLRIPERLFDPAAWQALGRRAVRHVGLRAENIAIDPGELDRLGITTYARGTMNIAGEASEGLADAKLAVTLRSLRGSPISQPIDADFLATIGDRGTQVTLSVVTRELRHDAKAKRDVPIGPVVQLLDANAKIPLTIAELQQKPRELLQQRLAVTAKIPNVPAKQALAVFGRSEITGGTLTGTIDVAGTIGAPTLRAHVVGQQLTVPPGPGGKPVKTVRQILVDASWDGQLGKLAIDGSEDNGMLELVATGSPTALADATVTLTAKEFDLVPLLAFAPGPAGGTAGRLDANLTMKGLDPRTARLAGELHLKHGRIPVAPDVGTLHRASVDVTIGASSAKVNIEGRLGAGNIKATGTIAMAGALPTGGDATITMRKVSPIGVVEPAVDGDATVKLHRDGDRWIADVAVRHAKAVVPKTKGRQLAKVGAPTDMVFVSGARITKRPMVKAPPAQPVFVVNLDIAPTWVESDEMRGTIRGKLTITADANAVGIVGTINTDRGDLDLFGHRYRVERAQVEFDGGIDPLLDIVITHDFADVSTTTQVRGRLSHPEIVMTSNPGTYSQGQLLGFLLGGDPGGDPGTAQDRATSAGASYVANELGGYVKKTLPIDLDVLRYEAATSTSSSAITVGTWLTHDLFVAYRQHLETRPDENAGEGQVEYYFTRQLEIEGVIGDRGYDGVDLLWRKRY